MNTISLINNIENDIIRWLKTDLDARKKALDYSRPENRLNRSWDLLDMIENQFSGLRISRENLFQDKFKGVYLKVIEDKIHILPPQIGQNSFINNILLKLDGEEQEQLEGLYSLDDSKQFFHINSDLDWEQQSFILNALTKAQYMDARNPDVRIEEDGTYYDAFELIHYLDLSKPLEQLPVKIPKQAIEGCVSRW